jgi:hypothetical protein
MDTPSSRGSTRLDAVGVRVAVGGGKVAVGSDVAVGGTRVAVGRDVAVGGTRVAVGGRGVRVGVDVAAAAEERAQPTIKLAATSSANATAASGKRMDFFKGSPPKG